MSIRPITDCCQYIVHGVGRIPSEIRKVIDAVVKFFSHIAKQIAEWSSTAYCTLKNCWTIEEPRHPIVQMMEDLHSNLPIDDFVFLKEVAAIEKAYVIELGYSEDEAIENVKNRLHILAVRAYVLRLDSQWEGPLTLRVQKPDLRTLINDYNDLSDQEKLDFIHFDDSNDQVKNMITDTKNIANIINTAAFERLKNRITF